MDAQDVEAMLNEAPKEKEKIQADYWWEQVIVLSKYDSKKGGTRRFQCRYCGIQRGGIAMRVKAHLMGLKGHGIGPCGKIPSHERARMEREYVLLPETRGSNNPTTIPASRPPSSSSAATSRGGETISHSSWPQSSRGTQGKQSNLFTSWHPQRKAQVDATVARFFYSCGISFNVPRSPFFKEMVAEIAQFGPTYQPPTFDALREKLLEDEVASIKEAILPVRQKWEAYGVSLVGDGWTNIRSTSLEGVLASCRGMPLYIESTECGARQKTAPILCEMWSKAVEYVGPKNVVQFVSDDEATNRAAGGLLQQKYPHITWSPCMAHCLNNLLKDIGGLTWAKTTFATGKEIVTFITRHHFSLALYRTFAKKQLLKYAETRFAYNFLMLRRLRNMRPSLKQMVASPEWAAWPTSHSTTAQTCYNEVIQEEYWVKVDQLLRVCLPIVTLLPENDPGSVRDARDEDNEEEDEEEQFEAQDCEDNDEEATPEIVVDHDVEL
ncbi:hypothetical protein L7F22_011062 [Adiantum nelumboides]|nr:hypothetical protein [Adiantum nelumboides]